jgi:hypothetical protein
LAESSKARAAVEAVARHFGAALETGADGPHAGLSINARRIRLDIATYASSTSFGPAKPRLRFDKVVIRLIRGLRGTLSESVPAGSAVVLAMAAPIRLAARTTAVLEDRIRLCLAEGADEFVETIHGNEVHARVVSGASRSAQKVTAFVHSPGTDPRQLIEMSQSILHLVGLPSRRPAEEHWSVLAVSDASPPADTWRQMFAELFVVRPDAKVLVVFPSGRLEEV